MQAGTLLQRVQDILQDTTGVRWPAAELLRYLNDAQREVVVHKPDASSETRSIPLVEGTRQSIPSDSLRLLDVIRNMGGDGETPGSAITLVGRGTLDSHRRSWHKDRPGREVDHFTMDVREPKVFYVHPPVGTKPLQVEVILTVYPDEVATVEDELGIEDIYANILIDYVLYRAYSKDADFAANLERALVHHQAVAAALGAKTAGVMGFSPRSAQRDTRGGPSSSPSA